MEPLEIAQQVLDAQPFSKHLGTQVTRFDTELSELVLDVRPEHKQQNGFVHGGVLSYLADNTLTFAGGTVLGTNVLTSEFKINYVRPGIGQRLIARATPIYNGKRQAVCECRVYVVNDGEEKLCAVAQGTIVNLDA